MGTALPVIRGASTALYPFTQTYIARTGKSDAESSAAVRWPSAYPLVQFQFNYDLLSRADKNTLKAAFVSAKGQFALNLTATLGGVTFNNLSFDGDEFAGAENTSRIYGSKWQVTQALPQSWSPGTSGGAYPTLSTGAISQLPYTQKQRFRTIVARSAGGNKYTYAKYAAGLTGFPTVGLMAWQFDENNLTDAEVATKIAHWLANWGDCFPFTFTDEDTTNYSNVYYASPQLVIKRQAYNSNSISTGLIQLS